VEVNEEGALYLPPDLLTGLAGAGTVEPYTRYLLEAKDGSIVLTRVEQQQPFWSVATSEERSAAFRNWAMSHNAGPALSNEAMRRENIYD
jgi:hypothetical protein